MFIRQSPFRMQLTFGLQMQSLISLVIWFKERLLCILCMMLCLTRDSVTYKNIVIRWCYNLQEIANFESVNSHTTGIENWSVLGINLKVPFDHLTKEVRKLLVTCFPYGRINLVFLVVLRELRRSLILKRQMLIVSSKSVRGKYKDFCFNFF